MEQRILGFITKYIAGAFYIPRIQVMDVVEVLILTFLIYRVILWIKNTKAWMLLKGILVLAAFILVAAIFRMNTILYLAKNSVTVMATAAIIVFQPELRRALEKLGERKLLASVLPFEPGKEKVRFSGSTRENIVEAAFAMGKAKTGALIVVEREIQLTEYAATGIHMDCLLSSQVLLNIFEHNTPLHDGAIIVRGNRIVSATCYLPLSNNMGISKELGTRHRAAIGMSEVSDALVIVVSEETGAVSVAQGGSIFWGITEEELRSRLVLAQEKKESRSAVSGWKLAAWWKGRREDEKKADK